MKLTKSITVLTFAVIFTSVLIVQASGSPNLINNGKFEFTDFQGHPDNWVVSHPNHLRKCQTTIEVITEDDITFMRVTKTADSEPGIGYQDIKIPEGANSLRISAKMRGNSIVRGWEAWQLPGVGVTYFYGSEQEAKQGQIDKWLKVPPGDSGWEEYESIIPVRDGATEGRITIIGQGWTGTFDITDIVVEVAH